MFNKAIIIIMISCLFQSGYEKAVIKYVPFGVMTSMSVNCKDFDGSFPELMRKINISNKSQLDSLSLLINKLEASKVSYSPDIRLKMILYGSNKIDTLCMGNFDIVMNGKIMKQSEQLKHFLDRLK